MKKLAPRLKAYCTICQSNETFKKLSNHKGYDILECLSCGLIRLSPFPADTDSLYNDEYFLTAGYNNYEKRFNTYRDIFEKLFAQRLKMIQKYKKSGKVLDIGCAHGFLLSYLKQAGYDCYGADVSDYAVQYAKNNFSIPIQRASIDSMVYPEESFDVIIMLDIIEHLKDPLATLKNIKKFLKKDGIIIMQTPFDIYHWEIAMRSFLAGEKIGSVEPSAIPMHLYFFTPRTSKQLAKDAGYKIKSFSTGTYGKIRMKTNPPQVGLNLFKIIYFKLGLRFVLTKIAEIFKISDGLNLILQKDNRVSTSP